MSTNMNDPNHVRRVWHEELLHNHDDDQERKPWSPSSCCRVRDAIVMLLAYKLIDEHVAAVLVIRWNKKQDRKKVIA